MKSRNGLFLFIFLSIFVCSAPGFSGCANIVPPKGGPRDTIAPILINSIPRDSSKQFTTNKIILTFDEYVDPKDIRTELLVNPVPKIDPIVDGKLRTVTIRLKDTLQENTTYSLNFGKGIKDVNEGNVRKNFTYIFSTGKHIDYGELSGYVYLAATGKVDSTLTVLLHLRFNDSAVVKDRPRYIAKLDSTGQFHFQYLQPGSYALYAMKDEGGSHKYLSKTQLFAFAGEPVVVGRNSTPVTLYAYSEPGDAKATVKSGTSGGTKSPPKTDKEKDRRLQLQTNIANGIFDVLDTLRLTFATGLRNFDSSKIRFTDENFADITPSTYRFGRDSTNKKFSLFYPWPTDTKFYLIAAKDFATDSSGRRILKIDTISFRTKKDIDYGEVRIRVPNLNLARRPVLQFVQSDAVKYSFPFSSRRDVRKVLFEPGEYELRILYDTNGNGIWDPGQFFDKHRQPEKVTPIRRKYTVKANWDNDLDITLTAGQ
jgi:uncharacterized protein (DUF2141 family)